MVALGVLAFAVPFCGSMLRRLLRGESYSWLGALWFVTVLSPVVGLRNLTLHHYLYVPIIGIALLWGLWLEEIRSRLWEKRPFLACTVLVLFCLATVGATGFHNLAASKNSWIAEASAVAKKSLEDLKRQRPNLSDRSSLYIIDRSPRDLPWFYDYGSLFRLFYPGGDVRVVFGAEVDLLPAEVWRKAGWVVLVYDGHELRDISPSGRPP